MALAVSAPNCCISTLVLPQRRPQRTRPKLALVEPRLSVVIINYRQWEQTARLVRELRKARCARTGRAEIVVVDNHSPPHRLAARLRRLPGLSLRRWGQNCGFARAANEGCRLSRGTWVLLLNPDISVQDEFLDRVWAQVERLVAEDAWAGIVGFQLRNGDGSVQLSSGFFPTLIGSLARLLLPRPRRKYRHLQGRRRCRTSWVTGCCFLLRRECWQTLGGFNEDFFLYYEDVDLCRRARAQGWSIYYEPAVQAVHYRPLHSRSVPASLRLITRHALLTYSARHWPAWQFRFLAAIVKAEAGLRARWAAWRNAAKEAGLFGQLQTIAGQFARGNRRAARRQLQRVLRQEQRECGA